MKTLSLRDARVRAKLTQEKLAELSGVDQTTISRLETHENPNPTQRTVEKLVDALGIAPSKLRFTRPQPEPSVADASDRVGHPERRTA